MTSLSFDPTLPDRSRLALAGTTLAVASGKGGVGKTWFSITLAHALSMMGQRSLLFDGDLGLANVDIQLGLMPKRDLGAVLGGTISLKRATEHFGDGGFDVIAGRSGSGNLATLPTHHLVELQQELVSVTKDYDRVIFDLAGSYSPAFLVGFAFNAMNFIVIGAIYARQMRLGLKPLAA